MDSKFDHMYNQFVDVINDYVDDFSIDVIADCKDIYKKHIQFILYNGDCEHIIQIWNTLTDYEKHEKTIYMAYDILGIFTPGLYTYVMESTHGWPENLDNVFQAIIIKYIESHLQ